MDYGSTPLSYQSVNPVGPVKGQTGLLIFGILAILLGAGSGCMGLMAPISLLVPQPRGAARMQAGAVIGGALLYLAVAGGFIWMGVGSIRRQRWVRPVVLAVMSLALVAGIFTLIAMAVVAPNIGSAMTTGSAPAPPPGIMRAIIAVMFVVPAVLLIGVPGAFILFYRKAYVRTALEYFDPTPRWTDRCPIPVLVLSAALAVMGASVLVTIPQGMAMFGGKILAGAPAMGVLAAEAAVALLLAYLTAKLRLAGWWGTIALVIFFAALVVPTNLRADLPDLYAKAGYTAEQVAMMRRFKTSSGAGSLIISGPIILLSLGYLLYVRKFFGRANGPRGEMSPSA